MPGTGQEKECPTPGVRKFAPKDGKSKSGGRGAEEVARSARRTSPSRSSSQSRKLLFTRWDQRRRLDGPVHARACAHLELDDVFIRVLGLDCRQTLAHCADYDTWRSGCKDFVKEWCALL
eukprot:9343150-Pyramimonas_sp.AAC.1